MARILKLLLVFVLSTFVFAEEPSAFDNQSGATKKDIKSLKDGLQNNSNKVISIENKLNELSSSFDGLSSLYAGQSKGLKEVIDANEVLTNNAESLSKDVSSLKDKVDENTNGIESLNKGMGEIKDSISQIQEMLSSIIKNVNDSKKSKNLENALDNNKDDKKVDDKPSPQFDENINKDDFFKETRRLVYAKKFNDAISRYTWLIKMNYKVAESNYMLGNIYYETNKYKDAVYHYKESAVLDDKAKYMPRLLLNSANSFRVLGDSSNAKKFYNSLLSLFPDTSEASDAKKQLDKFYKN